MVFKSLNGVRPSDELAKQLSAKNISTYSKARLSEMLKNEDYAFLKIIEPTLSSTKSDGKYSQVRENFEAYLEEGFYTKDRSSYYVYRQTLSDGESFHGIIGLLDLKSAENGKLQGIENTIPKRVKLFENYLSEVHFQADPVVVSYKEKHRITLLLELEMRKNALFDFETDDGKQHEVWRVNNSLVIKQISDSIKELDKLLILDGHHRFASSMAYRKSQMEADEEYIGQEAYNYLSTFLIADKQVKVNGYHRLVKDLNGLSSKEFLDRLEEVCMVVPKGETLYYPSDRNYCSLYLDGEFYTLFFDNGMKNGLDRFDCHHLATKVLEPILGIEFCEEKNERLDYVAGTSDHLGISLMKSKVDSGEFKLGFGLFPPVLEDLMGLNENEYLPAKSFYIEPRLLSGMIIHDMKE